MLKDIAVNLTGPICQCHKQDLSFTVEWKTFVVKCRNCETELRIPLDGKVSVKCYFILDTPYPEDSNEGKDL